jgi:hypothetical protein
MPPFRDQEVMGRLWFYDSNMSSLMHNAALSIFIFRIFLKLSYCDIETFYLYVVRIQSNIISLNKQRNLLYTFLKKKLKNNKYILFS